VIIRKCKECGTTAYSHCCCDKFECCCKKEKESEQKKEYSEDDSKNYYKIVNEYGELFGMAKTYDDAVEILMYRIKRGLNIQVYSRDASESMLRKATLLGYKDYKIIHIRDLSK